MTQTQQPASFQFVDWSQLSGSNKDPAARLLIRKQAMSKAAAARKQRGNWGKKNLGQIVIDTEDTKIQHTPDGQHKSPKPKLKGRPRAYQPIVDPLEDDFFKNLSLQQKDSNPTSSKRMPLVFRSSAPRNMSSKDYEMMRIECDFDLLDLSAMTCFHVGRITTQNLYRYPPRLIDVLRCRQWSYFSFIPSRWGHSDCLDDAARCVASRVRHWIGGNINPNAETLALYSKALTSLQAALSDSNMCLEADVLCATEILSIYELLDNKRDNAWAQHAAGARALVRRRGPDRFKSNFDRALFLAQVGPINTEALVENRKSFLEGEEWLSVFKSLVIDQPSKESIFADCGTAVVSLWAFLTGVPGVYKDVQEVVCNGRFPEEDVLINFKKRIDFYDDHVTRWLNTYEHQLLAPILDRSRATLVTSDKCFETLASCLAILLVMRKMRVALDPLGAQLAEEQAQNFAIRIRDLEQQAIELNPRAAIFLAFKMEMARATMATKDDWRVQSLLDYRVGANGLIAPWVFKRWCELKGRKI